MCVPHLKEMIGPIPTLALLSSLSVAMATSGVDVSQRTYVDNWSCMVNNGMSFAIVRVYQSNGMPDPNGKILSVDHLLKKPLMIHRSLQHQ